MEELIFKSLVIYAIFYALGTDGFKFIKEFFDKKIWGVQKIYKVLNCAFCFGFWSFLFIQALVQKNIVVNLSIGGLLKVFIRMIEYALINGIVVLVIELVIRNLEIRININNYIKKFEKDEKVKTK